MKHKNPWWFLLPTPRVSQASKNDLSRRRWNTEDAADVLIMALCILLLIVIALAAISDRIGRIFA